MRMASMLTTRFFPSLFLFVGFLLLGCAKCQSTNVSATAENDDDAPLWAFVPDTISPEWGPYIEELGENREAQMPAPDDAEGWKVFQDATNEALEAMADEHAATFGCTYKEMKMSGIPVVEITPSRLICEDKIAVYTHGGAYTRNSALGSLGLSMFFANETRLRAISIDYTLAPHSKWQETTDEVVAVFKALADSRGFSGKDIVLYGDSAGGSLAASATLKMRDLGMELPAALVLWSPWADIAETGDTYATLRDAEPYYTYKGVLGPSALAYAEAADHKHPYVSAVYGDFKQGDFPPTLIQGGTKEIFVSNFVRLYQALDQAGKTAKLDLYEGMPHVFQPSLPNSVESQAAIKKVRKWIQRYAF